MANDPTNHDADDSRDDDSRDELPKPKIVSGEGRELEALRAAVAASRGRRITPISLRRRVRGWFAPDRLKDFGTTLALVAPLTVLIWVWAEREETQTSHRIFYVELRSTDPTKTLTVANDGRSESSAVLNNGTTQNGRVAVDVTLNGPRSSLDSLASLLANDSSKAYLTLDVSDAPEPGRAYDLTVLPLIDQQNLFNDLGVTAATATPDKVHLQVDEVADRTVQIRVPPQLSTIVTSVAVQPATIEVHGPKQVIERLEQSNSLTAELDLAQDSPELAAARPGVPLSLPNVKLKPLKLPGLTVDAPQTVSVTLQVAPEEDGYIQSLTVNVSKPATMTGNVRVTPPTLTRVHVKGRADAVRRVVSGTGDVRPYAELVLTTDDIGKAGKKPPVFRNLPPGVRVVEGEVPEISFDATDRAGGPVP